MVGHAIVPALDTRPASISRTLVNGVLRKELGHSGLIFSDDLCMSPTYRRGVAQSARDALKAGVDVLLITYDMEVVYEVLAESRLPMTQAVALGDIGWEETVLDLPSGSWTDRLTGRAFTGSVRLSEILGTLPVAAIARDDG